MRDIDIGETKLRGKVAHDLRTRYPGFVVLLHEERRGGASGVPDMSVTGHGRTSWWEFKYADPDFESEGIQELTMLRLSASGYARYIIFEERNDLRSVRIIHPRHFKDWDKLSPDRSGLDYRWVADYIAQVHLP